MLLRSIRVLFFNKKFKNKEKNTEQGYCVHYRKRGTWMTDGL